MHRLQTGELSQRTLVDDKWTTDAPIAPPGPHRLLSEIPFEVSQSWASDRLSGEAIPAGRPGGRNCSRH